MKKKRYIVVGGAVVLAVILASVAVVGAWGHGRCFGRGFHPGFHHGKQAAGFILGHLDSKVEDLNLTGPQKEKYAELRGVLKTQLMEGAEEHGRLRESFRAEMARDNPDMARVAETMKKRIQDVSTIMQHDMDLFVAFYGILDDGQKKKVVSEIQKRMARREARREVGR